MFFLSEGHHVIPVSIGADTVNIVKISDTVFRSVFYDVFKKGFSELVEIGHYRIAPSINLPIELVHIQVVVINISIVPKALVKRNAALFHRKLVSFLVQYP